MKTPWMLLIAGLLVYQMVPDLPESMRKTAPEKSTVVARIDGQNVLADEVDDLLWDWRGKEALEELLTYRVISQAARAAQVKTNDEEIQQAMDELLQALESQLAPGQTVQQALDQQALVPSRLWFRVRNEVLLRKLILKDFDPAGWVKVSTIVVRPAGDSAAELQKALERSRALSERLKKGEAWATVQQSAEGGLVGWRLVSAFPESVRRSLGGEIGTMTEPASTTNGIQIFRLEATGKALTAETRRELENAVVAGRRTGFLNQLRQRSKVEVLLK